MKVILDSNVIVAAFAARGLCHSLFELCLDRCRIIISEHILSEVYRILHEKFKMPRSRVDAVRAYLVEFCENAHYEKLKEPTCRDKDDDEILAAQKLLAEKEGIFCEPASATSLAGALKDIAAGKIPEGSSVVCTLTGHGLKDPDTAIKQSTTPLLTVDATLADVKKAILDNMV